MSFISGHNIASAREKIKAATPPCKRSAIKKLHHPYSRLVLRSLGEGGREKTSSGFISLRRDKQVERNLNNLAPDIVEAIVNGAEPDGLSIAQIMKNIPEDWNEQRRFYGFPER